jgi:signal transduction histidine kinase/response regulator RpfG family c-di-GMP phosphodiesterase
MTRILAIHCNEHDLVPTSAVFTKLIPGCHVMTARSAKEGMDMALSQGPDVILLDHDLVETDGVAVCKRLKSDERTRDIPLIMITGNTADAVNRLEGQDVRADALVAPPIDETALVSQIRLALRCRMAEDGLHKQRILLENTIEERTQALRAKEQELALRNRLTQVLATSPEKGLYTKVLETVLEAMESSQGTFGYVDQRGTLICPSWTKDVSKGDSGEGRELLMARERWGPVLRGCILEKETVCLNEPVTLHEMDASVSRILAVPILYDDRVIGLLQVGNKLLDYEEKDRRLLEALSNGIAPVLKATLQSSKEKGELKHAEEEKRRLETRLRQAQKIQAIGTLAGGIAHDFNNILAAILGYAELVRLQIPKGNKARDHLNEVVGSTYRARDLVRQILTFSRQTEQERRPVYIHLITKEALRLLRASLPSTIQFRQNITTDSGLVRADPTEIHQVLMNLCTNAHEAMSKSGGTLEVSLLSVDLGMDDIGRYPDVKPGPYLKLSVADTGHGMYPQTVERIFDPYFTTKEKGSGTGLGLAVVHGIVANLGGTIDVESVPGKGTAFHVWLPRVEEGSASESETSEEPATGNERILFIDDEEPLVNTAKQMLTHLGYQVVARTSSIEALELFREEPDQFDLVITDMTMPHMTGDKLAQELMGIRSDIPVILCTGFSERITQEEAKRVGVKAFLMKPIASGEMARVIRRTLSSAGLDSSVGGS